MPPESNVDTKGFIEKLRGAITGGGLPKGMLIDAIEEAANRMESLHHRLIEAEAVANFIRERGMDRAQWVVDGGEMVKMANMLRNGTHRVYMVRANDYSRGTVMPVRIATANTLSAMIDRCAEDCYGKDAKQVGTGSWDLTVMVTVGELEVQSE